MTLLKPSKTKSSMRSSSAWKFTDSSTSIPVGTSRLVSVKVESCLGSQPICSTRLPSFENATDKLDDVVLLPIPPLPYTENTFAVPIFCCGSSCTCTLPSPSPQRDRLFSLRWPSSAEGGVWMFMRQLLRLRGDLPVLRRPDAAHRACRDPATNICAREPRSAGSRL